MLAVRGILETCLYVDDVAVAETFYSRLLNVDSFSKVEPRHVFFRLGEQMLLLFNPAETEKPIGDVPAHGARGAGHVAFAVAMEEVSAWRAHLAACGIVIEAEITWPSGGQSIYFRDPARNSLEIVTTQTWG